MTVTLTFITTLTLPGLELHMMHACNVCSSVSSFTQYDVCNVAGRVIVSCSITFHCVTRLRLVHLFYQG